MNRPDHPLRPASIRTRAGDLDFSTGPLLMGILNVTPDSFSDGGRDGSVEESVARAERLTEEGATIIDVGGESTRPGATPVSLDVELKRVIPVVQFLVSRHPRLPLSVDTTKAEVARVALEEGAALINDVSALSDPWMAPVLRDHDAPVVVMHRQGDPRIMQVNPAYQDVIREIKLFFEERLAFAATQGLQADRILLDPGIGFGKTTDHNLEILRRLPDFASLGRPLVLGLSRKSFLGRLLGGESTPLSPSERLEASLAAALWAAAQGTQILRVHDVRATARALTVWRNLAS